MLNHRSNAVAGLFTHFTVRFLFVVPQNLRHNLRCKVYGTTLAAPLGLEPRQPPSEGYHGFRDRCCTIQLRGFITYLEKSQLSTSKSN